MLYPTKLFGEIAVEETNIIKVERGIFGFEQLKRYAVIAADPETPLFWLQSLEEPQLAFVIVNPFIIIDEYEPEIRPADLAELEIEDRADVIFMAIVTLRENYLETTANLRAPIIINRKNLQAKQVVLDDLTFQIQYNMIANISDEREAAEDCQKMKDELARISCSPVL
ncbi:MAG: flagellar assembly protein FliW [Gallionella sp.]|nr:flagellar assembly protein FliW [Gallionella sp.]